jgi:hypothetical protein
MRCCEYDPRLSSFFLSPGLAGFVIKLNRMKEWLNEFLSKRARKKEDS